MGNVVCRPIYVHFVCVCACEWIENGTGGWVVGGDVASNNVSTSNLLAYRLGTRLLSASAASTCVCVYVMVVGCGLGRVGFGFSYIYIIHNFSRMYKMKTDRKFCAGDTIQKQKKIINEIVCWSLRSIVSIYYVYIYMCNDDLRVCVCVDECLLCVDVCNCRSTCDSARMAIQRKS